jgi:hypothetical protein
MQDRQSQCCLLDLKPTLLYIKVNTGWLFAWCMLLSTYTTILPPTT